MNPSAVLGLIGDLYAQIEALQKEIEGLKIAEGAKAKAAFDPLAGPEEAIAQARKESES